ncbi:BlaI/MecI/CopY family transcriptional regulator [Aliikangiella coralliicola]|uniref:BlaI/MecI/CopY family transcriptional regulator n=1 Tax=Aliikangiella coralliicola TaxID=2592383 RepID=A0A545U782_9GAMM|nr:BlaI/MecI/CopY family transcriptional regulator [Aliikangiella coralliicola]TQV85304.1 BlaI/MecI/CopY family transcriptional regulator [Aliikangiella coralliicola]
MAKQSLSDLPDLTKNELQLLNILWKSEEGYSVREVHQQIEHENGWAYSTTKTTMDRMVKKGLLDRKDFHGVFLYQAAISKPAGLARLVSYFMNDVLHMDSGALMSLFGRSKALSESEIDELESLLKQGLEKEKSK